MLKEPVVLPRPFYSFYEETLRQRLQPVGLPLQASLPASLRDWWSNRGDLSGVSNQASQADGACSVYNFYYFYDLLRGLFY